MHAEPFAERLMRAVSLRGSAACVGLDPVLDRLPEPCRGTDPVASIERFSLGVMEAVAPLVPCVKLQAACYERYGERGVAAYRRLVAAGRALGLLVIGDAKRGDIGVSSDHYAWGCLADQDGSPGPDALTVNAYLGIDGIEPFIRLAAAQGKGLFALVRTSNPGGDALQSQPLRDGRTVSELVADLVAQAGQPFVGASGYSLLGAVVGATKPADVASLRARMPEQIFLVPGFGAQGGSAADVRACFHAGGRGALVTASRSVIFAHAERGAPTGPWAVAVSDAAKRMIDELRAAVG